MGWTSCKDFHTLSEAFVSWGEGVGEGRGNSCFVSPVRANFKAFQDKFTSQTLMSEIDDE